MFDTNELRLLLRALNSHIYWQLSDNEYRRDGYVQPPGSNDPEAAAEISECASLEAKIERLLGGT